MLGPFALGSSPGHPEIRHFGVRPPHPPEVPEGEDEAMNPAIEVRDVHVHAGHGRERVPVLRGVDLAVRPGGIVFLVGPSGSGKTTLLSILGGILTPDRGHVRVLGQDLAPLDPERRAAFRRRHLGFVFQGFHLLPTLSALDNIRLALAMRAVPRRESKRRASMLLDQVGLAHRARVRPNRLSTGECQRVAIARALAGDPTILLADEPTAALDAENGREAMRLLSDLVHDRGATLVVVTHDDRIFPFADRILRLVDGRITGSSGRVGGPSAIECGFVAEDRSALRPRRLQEVPS